MHAVPTKQNKRSEECDLADPACYCCLHAAIELTSTQTQGKAQQAPPHSSLFHKSWLKPVSEQHSEESRCDIQTNAHTNTHPYSFKWLTQFTVKQHGPAYTTRTTERDVLTQRPKVFIGGRRKNQSNAQFHVAAKWRRTWMFGGCSMLSNRASRHR